MEIWAFAGERGGIKYGRKELQLSEGDIEVHSLPLSQLDSLREALQMQGLRQQRSRGLRRLNQRYYLARGAKQR